MSDDPRLSQPARPDRRWRVDPEPAVGAQSPSADDGLEARLASVRSGIADAARVAGRSPDELTLIVVTKYHPASLVRELAALGVTDVGENRHQEAQAKAAECAILRS